MIIERDGELSAMGGFLDGVASGKGGALLIEATSGLGKTTLLTRLQEDAAGRGMDLLLTRVGHLDASFPYLLVRRLLGRPVERAGGGRALTGAAAFAAPLFAAGAALDPAVGYGAQWFVFGLAEVRPTLLVVDDAHWADPASLTVLSHVAEDAGEVALGIVLASRPTEGPAAQRVLAGMRTSARVTVLQPDPLSAAGVAHVASETLGTDIDAGRAGRLHRASAGNPLVLRALLTDRAVGERLDLPGYVPGALSAAIASRLGQLGDEAAQVAHAAAILDGATRIRLLSSVSGCSSPVVADSVERLRAASLINDAGAFPHPVVREAVEACASPERVRMLHARAARALIEAGAEHATVLPHALAAEPGADPLIAGTLLAGAIAADRAGSPQTALELLTRAEAEPPSAAQLPQVVLELGRVELRLGRAGAEHDLRRVLELTDAPELRAVALERLVEVAYSTGARHLWRDVLEEAVPLLGRTAEDAGEEAVALRAALAHLTFATDGPEVPPEVAALVRDPFTLPLRHAADQLYALFCARALSLRGRLTPAEFAAVVRRLMAATPEATAIDDPRQAEVELVAASYLMASDEFDLVDALCDRAARRPQVLGAPDLQLQLQTRRLGVALRRGELQEVFAGAPLAIEDAQRLGSHGYVAYLSSYLARAHLAVGDSTAALAALVPTSEVVEIELLRHLLREEFEAAVALRERAVGTQEGLTWQSRLLLATACRALGRESAARELVEDEIRCQQAAGSRGFTADALRFKAASLEAPEARSLLEEAAEHAAASPRLCVRAEVYADLGTARLATGDEAGARGILSQSIELAVRTGARRTLQRAQTTMRRAGGRPRRLHQTGVESLSPSERRVAALAAAGRSNREIAEELYLTLKTVETHLGATYRKLGVAGRPGLREAIAG